MRDYENDARLARENARREEQFRQREQDSRDRARVQADQIRTIRDNYRRAEEAARPKWYEPKPNYSTPSQPKRDEAVGSDPVGSVGSSGGRYELPLRYKIFRAMSWVAAIAVFLMCFAAGYGQPIALLIGVSAIFAVLAYFLVHWICEWVMDHPAFIYMTCCLVILWWIYHKDYAPH
jgi:hypothetical protein